MTRDEILAMEPGPELDERIDTTLYGMEFKSFPYGRMCYRNGGWTLAKPYSTDMSAAWEVVEKLKRNEKRFFIESGIMWFCKHEGKSVFANTAPEAICKATLLAVMDA